MLNQLDSPRVTPQEFAVNLRTTGWIVFWVQLGLAVVSGLILGFALADPNFNLKASKLTSGAGLVLAAAGILVLCLSIYWAFRYTRVAKQLQDRAGQLKKSAVIHTLQRGFSLNAVGMLLTLLGIEAIVGTLIAKSLTQVEGLAIYNASQLIEPLDLLVIQANVNTIVAQFIGIVFSGWLLSRLNHH